MKIGIALHERYGNRFFMCGDLVENSALKLRSALVDDLEDILRLHQGLENDGEPTLSLLKATELFDRISSYPDYGIYVATIGGGIVGTFALLIMDNLAHGGSRSAILEDMVVGAEGRGKGIGRAMIKEAVNMCTAKSCYKMTLSSNISRSGAHNFYESLGFEKHGYSFAMSLEK